MLLLTQPRTYAGDSIQPRDPATRAATRTETAVTMMEQSQPCAKAASVPIGSQAAAAVPEAAAAVPEAATFTRAMSTTIAQPAAVAVPATTIAALMKEVAHAATDTAQGLRGLGVVVLGVVAVGNRGRIVFATGRVIVSRNFTGNCVLQMPPVRPHRGIQSQSEHGGQ